MSTLQEKRSEYKVFETTLYLIQIDDTIKALFTNIIKLHFKVACANQIRIKCLIKIDEGVLKHLSMKT